MNELTYNNYLQHFGILGMKWGVRRYQNPDGTLTEAGKRRYGTTEGLEKARQEREERKEAKEIAKKDKAIATGNAKMIRKYADRMTTQELQNAATRAQYVSNVKAIQNRGKPKLDPVNTVTNALRKTSSLMNAVSDTAGAIDRIKKLLEDPDERKAREKEKQRKADDEKVMLANLRTKAKEIFNDTYDKTPGTHAEKLVAATNAKNDWLSTAYDAESGRITKESLEAERKKKENSDENWLKKFMDWGAERTGKRKPYPNDMDSDDFTSLNSVLSTKVSDIERPSGRAVPMYSNWNVQMGNNPILSTKVKDLYKEFYEPDDDDWKRR